MKIRYALPIAVSAFALVVGGCSSDRFARVSVNPVGYAGESSTAGIPSRIDAFSRDYIPFPVTATETPPIIGHSAFCGQHYNQPGCPTYDGSGGRYARNDNDSRRHRGDMRDGRDGRSSNSTNNDVPTGFSNQPSSPQR